MKKELIFYTVQEVADILKVDYRTVLKYIYANKLEAYKLSCQWRIPEKSLEIFLGNLKSNYELQ